MAVVVTARSGYDLGYVWKGQRERQADDDSERVSSGGYYIDAAQQGEAPGRWFGAAALRDLAATVNAAGDWTPGRHWLVVKWPSLEGRIFSISSRVWQVLDSCDARSSRKEIECRFLSGASVGAQEKLWKSLSQQRLIRYVWYPSGGPGTGDPGGPGRRQAGVGCSG